MKTLIIDRATWARGPHPDGNYLLDGNGNRCCLGFYAKQLAGLSDHEILHNAEPCEVTRWPLDDGLCTFSRYATEVCCKLINENDADILEEEREAKIAELFASIGIKVTFIN